MLKYSALLLLAVADHSASVMGQTCSGTVGKMYDVTPKVYSEDGQGVAWIEQDYTSCSITSKSNFCFVPPCITKSNYLYTIRTADFTSSTSNTIGSIRTWTPAAVVGQVVRLYYQRNSQYVLVATNSAPSENTYTNTIALYRPDGRSIVIDSWVSSNCFSQWGCKYGDAVPSPSGDYIAVATTSVDKATTPPFASLVTLTVSIRRACDLSEVTKQVIPNWKPAVNDENNFIKWVDDRTIRSVESENFARVTDWNAMAGKPQTRGVATITFDPVARTSTLKTEDIVVTDVSGADLSPYPICSGVSTKSSWISLASSSIAAQKTTTTGVSDDASNLVRPATYKITSVNGAKYALWNCAAPTSSRVSTTFPRTIKCDCGVSSTTTSTSTYKPACGTACNAGDTTTGTTNCKLFWKQSTCSRRVTTTSGPLLNTCKAVALTSTTGFNEDSEFAASSDGQTTNDGQTGVLDEAAVAGISVAGVFVVAVAAFAVKKSRSASKPTRV
jgi:hypothetical protein